MSLVLQLLANAIVNAAMFAVLAVGFGLVYRSIHVFHLAYGALFVLSGFIFFLMVKVCGLGWWAAGAWAVASSAGAGGAMEFWFYRPFYERGVSSTGIMVASLGFGFVLENGLALIFGNEIQTISRGVARPLFFGQVSLTILQMWQVALCVAILVGLAATQRLSFFKVLHVMGENPELLLVHGWNLPRYRAAACALGTALASVVACLTMLDIGMDVHAGMSYVMIAAVAVLAGGSSRMAGWVLGGVVLALLQSIVAWKLSTKWIDLVAFVVLLAVLLFRREGFLGISKRVEES